MASPQFQTLTTEKYIPFQLSRVRFSPIFGSQIEPLVITGSSLDEVDIWLHFIFPHLYRLNTQIVYRYIFRLIVSVCGNTIEVQVMGAIIPSMRLTPVC